MWMDFFFLSFFFNTRWVTTRNVLLEMNDSGSIIWQALLIFISKTSQDSTSQIIYYIPWSEPSQLDWKIEHRLISISCWDPFVGFPVCITYSINSELNFCFFFLLFLLLILHLIVQSFYGRVLSFNSPAKCKQNCWTGLIDCSSFANWFFFYACINILLFCWLFFPCEHTEQAKQQFWIITWTKEINEYKFTSKTALLKFP